jgi:hypothetical protein
MTTGDVILVKGTSWIARAIQFFMNIYRHLRGYGDIQIYNHAAMFVEIFGEIYVAEALGKGVTIAPYKDTYLGKDNYIILEPVVPITPKEKDLLLLAALKSSFRVTRYDFSNFFFQIILIFTGKWYGRKGKKAERRLYCSEAVATWWSKIRPRMFVKPSATNPLDILVNTNFKLKVVGEE